MRNVSRRLQVLERFFPFRPAPSPVEQIRSLALQSLSLPDLDLLVGIRREQSAGAQPRELLEGEEAACIDWTAALEAEPRRMGCIPSLGLSGPWDGDHEGHRETAAAA